MEVPKGGRALTCAPDRRTVNFAMPTNNQGARHDSSNCGYTDSTVTVSARH